MKPEASLKYIFKEIQHTVYHDKIYDDNPDLTRWSNQGVLLLNAALTTTVNKPGSHQLLWRPFIAFLIDILNWRHPELVYILMGATAAKWSNSIIDTNYKIITTHPASAAYLNADRWDSDDAFNKCNQFLSKLQKETIIW